MAMTSGGRGPAPAANDSHGNARDALRLMMEALELIDSSEGADIAGAHLDLAIHRLRDWIESEGAK
jgi:hypothetical protein